MASIGDINWIFNSGRLIGCTVLVATKDNVKVRRFRDVIFILFSMSLYFVSFVILLVYVLAYNDVDSKTMLLLFTRILLFYSSIFMDAALTTLWIWKIRSVLSQLQNFDCVTKYDNPVRKKRLRIACRIIVIVTSLYWAIAAYLTYSIEIRVAIFRGILYFIINTSVNIQILIFAGILFLIGERFRHLCDIVTLSKEYKLIAANRSNGHLTLQQIWWLHCSLVNAAELINSVYAVQLLLWISMMSINVLSRIYSLNDLRLSDSGKIRETMLVIDCAVNLVLITTVCHMTAYQANRVGELIFSPYSSVSMKRVFLQEHLEIAAYFQLRKVHFSTIAGIIRVDLPLLLSIFSAVTTYLVILS
ncbi:uncharacterized protein LOC143432961 [Xylocopa sonorina]|uniref:uncharacterized protein LOC143432961 n=1 Tax=Xylocopa sonorina TaxID=1818115 RepID=UPI00403B2404